MIFGSEADASTYDDPDFKQLNAQEAQVLRQRLKPVSPWRIIGFQVLAGGVVAALAWWLTGRATAGWSAAYGALAVVLPALVFARGLVRQQRWANAGAALLGFFVWELVKIVLTVMMLLAAPKLIGQLNWLALLAGFVVVLKVNWVAMGLLPLRKDLVNKT